MKFADIHTHILSRIDDGSSGISETKELLKMLRAQGVEKVIATPHFLAEKTALDAAVRRAEDCYNKTMSALEGEEIPEILQGFEVSYFRNIAESEEIFSLTLNHSHYILLELSHLFSADCMIKDIIALKLNRGITPILAHIERFADIKGFDKILSTISDGFSIGQINASSFRHFSRRKLLFNLISDKYATIVASDTHSVNQRPPMFDLAFSKIEKKLGIETVNTLKKNSLDLYGQIKSTVNK